MKCRSPSDRHKSGVSFWKSGSSPLAQIACRATARISAADHKPLQQTSKIGWKPGSPCRIPPNYCPVSSASELSFRVGWKLIRKYVCRDPNRNQGDLRGGRQCPPDLHQQQPTPSTPSATSCSAVRCASGSSSPRCLLRTRNVVSKNQVHQLQFDVQQSPLPAAQAQLSGGVILASHPHFPSRLLVVARHRKPRFA